MVLGVLSMVASLVAEHRFQGMWVLVVAACRFIGRGLWALEPVRCAQALVACSMWSLSDQGLNPSLCIGRWILMLCTISKVLVHSLTSVLRLLQFLVILKLLFQALLTSSKLLNAYTFLQHFHLFQSFPLSVALMLNFVFSLTSVITLYKSDFISSSSVYLLNLCFLFYVLFVNCLRSGFLR